MHILKIKRLTTVEVDSFADLQFAWRCHDPLSRMLIRRWICRVPLTAPQLRRLPQELKAQLDCPAA